MCWRGDGCDLANGLKQGIETVAHHLQTQADLVDQRVRLFRSPFETTANEFLPDTGTPAWNFGILEGLLGA